MVYVTVLKEHLANIFYLLKINKIPMSITKTTHNPYMMHLPALNLSKPGNYHLKMLGAILPSVVQI